MQCRDDDDDDDDDVGSPFQFTVGPVKNGGAHKVAAIGEGLHSATVNQPGICVNCTSHLMLSLCAHTALCLPKAIEYSVVTQVRKQT